MLPVRAPTVPHLPPPTVGCHPAVPVVEKSVISGVVGETPGVHVGAAVVPPEFVFPPVSDEPPELVFPPEPVFPPVSDEPPELVFPPEPVFPPVSDEPPELVFPPVAEELLDELLVDPPVTEELEELLEAPPVLDEPPVAGCPPVFWLLDFALLQFAIAAVKAKQPIHAAIVG